MTYTANIYFEDEAPRIGCGWRYCNIEIGRKWARVTERATGKRVRFPKEKLDSFRQAKVRR